MEALSPTIYIVPLPWNLCRALGKSQFSNNCRYPSEFSRLPTLTKFSGTVAETHPPAHHRWAPAVKFWHILSFVSDTFGAPNFYSAVLFSSKNFFVQINLLAPLIVSCKMLISTSESQSCLYLQTCQSTFFAALRLNRSDLSFNDFIIVLVVT